MIPNLIFVLRRRWPILLLLPIVSVAVVVALTPERGASVTQYTAGVYLAGLPDQTDVISVKQAAIDIKQPEVAERAAQILEIDDVTDPKRFAAPLVVRVVPESLTIRLSVKNPDEEFAAEYPMAFAQAYLDFTEGQLNAEYVEQLQVFTDINDAAAAAFRNFQIQNVAQLQGPNPDPLLQAESQALQEDATLAANNLREFTQDPVTNPFRIQDADEVTKVPETKLELPASRSVRAVLALVLGILAAIGLTAFIEKLNPRIDTPGDAERIVGAPVLAMVPIMSGKRKGLLDRADLKDFSGPFAESFRAMRSHLDFRSATEGLDRPPSVMIVSSAPSEGKTTSTAFLALTYAEVGREVVVIGGDFRRPAIHRLFGVPRTPGLSSRFLESKTVTTPEELVRGIVKRDELTGVRVVPSGPATDRVTGLLGDLSAMTSAGIASGCTVIIDTAPVMVANDAIDFLPSVDWVIVVVRLGRTTERSLRQTVSSLELNDAKIAGCVMVGSLEASDAKKYYYSYYKVDEDREVLAEQQIADSKRRRRGKSTEGFGEDNLPVPNAEPDAEASAEPEDANLTD